MTNSKVNPNADALKASFENLKGVPKTTWITMIVAAVAQYGVAVIIKRLASIFLTGAPRFHQRLAIAVATYVITVACKGWIKVKAAEATDEVIQAAKYIIALFNRATVSV